MDKSELVPITVALYFTCKDNSRIHEIDPGACGDGSARIKRVKVNGVRTEITIRATADNSLWRTTTGTISKGHLGATAYVPRIFLQRHDPAACRDRLFRLKPRRSDAHGNDDAVAVCFA